MAASRPFGTLHRRSQRLKACLRPLSGSTATGTYVVAYFRPLGELRFAAVPNVTNDFSSERKLATRKWSPTKDRNRRREPDWAIDGDGVAKITVLNTKPWQVGWQIESCTRTEGVSNVRYVPPRGWDLSV
jgi:hypothetical protein